LLESKIEDKTSVMVKSILRGIKTQRNVPNVGMGLSKRIPTAALF